MKNSKIYKVAGLSLVGFCAVSIGIDRANVGPVISQAAGFCGALLGALVAQRRERGITLRTEKENLNADHDKEDALRTK